jgi:hypothetical protein
MASPGTYNLVVPQTTTYTFSSVIQTDSTPWDLTNYTAVMTVRPFLGSTTVTLLATTGNGKITLGGVTGSITVELSALDTTLKAESYVYDLVLDSGSEITRILEGQFIVTAGVTTV